MMSPPRLLQIAPRHLNRDIQAVVRLSENILLKDGMIELGKIIYALSKGTTKVKYGRMVLEHSKAFVGLPDHHLRGVYEEVLFHLEVAHGPLTTKDDNTVWRYEGREGGQRATLIFDRAEKRAASLAALVHPDATVRSPQGLPSSVWRLSPIHFLFAAA